MKIRSKILLMLIILGFVFVLLSNYIFDHYSRKYLESQEVEQFNTISRNMDAYLNERMQSYLGAVNDWGHWDDMYDYMIGQNPIFAERNVVDDTFVNLGISFLIITEESKGLKISQYYDSDSMKMTGFPDDFSFDQILRMSENVPDTTGFVKNGELFYVVASSEITDSSKEKSGKGMLIIGRQIDQEIIGTLENMTGGKVSISLVNTGSDQLSEGVSPVKYENGVVLKYAGMSRDNQVMSMDFLIPANAGEGKMIKFCVLKPRTLFMDGIRQVEKFILVYTLIMLGFVMFTNLIFGEFLSKPFTRLIHEVKDIDGGKDSNRKLAIHGRNEFTFLRQSINNLLETIKMEQDIVKEGKDKLQATLNSVGDAVTTIDSMGNIDFMNPIAEQLTGSRIDEVKGHPFESVFNLVNRKSGEKIDSPVRKAFELKRIVEFSEHVVLVSKDGTEIAIEDTAAPIINESGMVIGVVLVFRDCSAKMEEKQHIEYLSFHDHLTGLYNRRFFEEELKRVDTSRNLPLSIVYADVNGLKTVNDAFGHQSGDLFIQKASHVLSHECRADDIIARTGGDEFVILLPKTSAEDADAMVKRVQQAAETQQILGIKLSLAFGSATKENEAQSVLRTLKVSEEAMYRAKSFNSSSKRNAVIKTILETLLIKSPKEDAHSKRVGQICADIANAYKMTGDKVNELRVAGELHDIGKITIDETVLNKTGRLTETEMAQIKGHPETGYRLLGTSSDYYNIAEYIRSHHERWDGMGYPKGEKAGGIPWNARVIALADSYDAMTSGRSYKAACSVENAAAEIKKNSGTQFDPEIARVFVEKVLDLDWSSIET